MSSGYGIKCEAETLPLLNSSYSASSDSLNDMDLAGFLDVDDKSLSGSYIARSTAHLYYIHNVHAHNNKFYTVELTGGMNVSEWSSLFNGQLDGLDTLDPMTGIQNTVPGHGHGPAHNTIEAVPMSNNVPSNNNGMDM